MSGKTFLHCPNKKCTFSKMWRPSAVPELFCPSCGTDLINACPECELALANPERGHCSYCNAGLLREVESAATPEE